MSYRACVAASKANAIAADASNVIIPLAVKEAA
jgi:hypothetical protein